MDDLDTNQSLGAGDRYAIRCELGRGMMGAVYEAEDTVLGRVVAVKTIELALGVSEEVYQQFERRFFFEARIAAQLSHPGIVVCHDVGKDPATGKLFIVFEHLKGETLAARLSRGPMPWRDGVGVVVSVARAIEHAHRNGVVHRDLKPANVMLLTADPSAETGSVSRVGAVKIMDFGVAKLETIDVRLTATGQSFGSPCYVSPEQALGAKSDARSDIFSLGSVLCTVLLGRPWFDASSIPEILRRVVQDDAPRLSTLCADVPPALDRIVERALAKRPEERYASAAAFADDLEAVASGRPSDMGGQTLSLHPGSPDSPLADLVPPPGGAADPADVLADLVGEGAVPAAANAGAEAPPAPPGVVERAVESEPPPAAAHAAARRPRNRLGMAAAAAVLILGATAVWVFRAGGQTRSVSEPSPSPSAVAAEGAPAEQAVAAGVNPGLAGERDPALATPTAQPKEVTPAPTSERPRADVPERGRRPAIVEPSAVTVPPSPPPLPPRDPAPQTRMRLNLEHPLERGRLNVWIDGVLVLETKLSAEVEKRIVAIKVREGRLETLLDVAPGRHQVKLEVSWNGEHRIETTIVDVAPGTTGLLEARLARLTKDLSLKWSSLAP